jgi:hypothetical protein
VFDRAAAAIEHHQARVVTAFQRRLGDQLRRQIVVEFG